MQITFEAFDPRADFSPVRTAIATHEKFEGTADKYLDSVIHAPGMPAFGDPHPRRGDWTLHRVTVHGKTERSARVECVYAPAAGKQE